MLIQNCLNFGDTAKFKFTFSETFSYLLQVFLLRVFCTWYVNSKNWAA